MLKITRRPYTACPFRWSLSTSGISTGEGDCSEAQCAELNGDFLLDFSACESKHGKLVWDGDCEPSGGGKGCNGFILTASIDVTGFDCASTYSGTFVFRSLNPSSSVTDDCLNFFQCSYYSTKSGNRLYFMPTTECKPACSPPTTEEAAACGSALFGGTVSHCLSVLELAPADTVYMIQANPAFPLLIDHGCMDFTADHVPNYYYDSMTTDVDGCPLTVTYTKASDAYSGSVVGTWPSEIVFTVTTGGSGSTGPDKNDRIRSKWHLEYDIDATLWTLRSFNRVDYPIYTLSDADPCTGFTKTLLLADKGDAADGCGVAPSEVTITRVCPPDRVGKSALLEDRKPNGATGKTKRQCGCDCQDEVDDRRHTCATKCTSTEDEGCENIDPTPDDITCRYPEAINCCENTAGKDVPCAYTVEFECDLFFDIDSVRHKIAAKQVVMRRRCYFEDGCEFVAAGPESSTGGSPVMDTDGFPGAQPVCSSCADPCLTGCTWDAWTVAECPNDGDCLPRCNYCWSLALGVITIGGDSVYSGGTVELFQVSSTPSPNQDGYALSEEFAGVGDYRLIAQVRVVECEVSAVIYIVGTSNECASPLDGDLYIAYGELGGQSSFCPQSPMTVCPEEITITRCQTSDRNCTGLDVVAPSSLTFTRIDCP